VATNTSLHDISVQIGRLQEQGMNAERSRTYIKQEITAINNRLMVIEKKMSAQSGQGDDIQNHDDRIRLLETDLNQRIGKAKVAGVAAGFAGAIGVAGVIETIKHFFDWKP